jgi:hypothetical protein
MINKYEEVSFGVYWDGTDVGAESGRTKAKINSKTC